MRRRRKRSGRRVEEAVDTGAGREARSADQRQPSANLNQPAQLPPGRVGCPSSARYGMYVHNIHSDDCSSAPSVEPFLDPPAGLFCYSCATCVIKVLLRVAFPDFARALSHRPSILPRKTKNSRAILVPALSRSGKHVSRPCCCCSTRLLRVNECCCVWNY